MKIPKTLDDINSLINNQVEESFHLEYKASDALKNNLKIAKEVSAMANAAGGIIIYGIKEFDENTKQHLPEKTDPIVRTNFSKEKLEQIIMSNISPKLQGLLIHSVSMDTKGREVVYVVEIPQSVTAHQNTVDHKYYIRFNFEAVPMLDYQIRDIMNRNKHPKVELLFEIEKTLFIEKTTIQGSGNSIAERLINGTQIEEEITAQTLKVTPINNGSVVSEYINYFVQLPENVLDPDRSGHLSKVKEGVRQFYGENTVQDLLNVSIHTLGNYGPSRFHPLLPKMTAETKHISLTKEDIDEGEITWTVYADNSEPISGTIQLADIPHKTVDDRIK
ncbi:MAG: helix-turn-helix domain-containing protein [Gelidibacter sp.]